MVKRKHFLWLFFFAFCFISYGQGGFALEKGNKFEKVRFKFVNNLILIPIEVNGVELSFILDTGVNNPILFNLTGADSVEIKNAKEILLKGLGEGKPIKAIRSTGNRFRLGDVYNNNQDLFLISDSSMNLSPRMGLDVHGIIGYDILKNFIVEINYSRKKIKFHDPDKYMYKNCRKCETRRLHLEGSKAYVFADVKQFSTNKWVGVKLLLDTGSSDALWLFENKEQEIVEPAHFFDDFLGFGLSGRIHGKRARVKNFIIAGLEMEGAKVAYPDSLALQYINSMRDRNGSLGSEILRRFNLILDYPNNKITFKKNSSYKDPFKYNMSGIELQHNGLRVVKALAGGIDRGVKDNSADNRIKILASEQFHLELHPALEIAEIREGSPAHKVGLKEGDVIVEVNNRNVYRYSLQEVRGMINKKAGEKIYLTVDRSGSELKFSFVLKKVL
ncbi:PDZ domain-containing protein [Galbibacter sp. EGI 63066]|uniref:PDZ domain-containing protein n=1 Tax=Galbibacter sp. EGI 63066 TaxID=2993559 RepID=UPI00224927CC|nr:PDZ domain-containing protein [Galbibacter sp. EGI 63066]MCX2681158.1 PDZ domain-containing protein [Galbibacter sp. EGI 63066]